MSDLMKRRKVLSLLPAAAAFASIRTANAQSPEKTTGAAKGFMICVQAYSYNKFTAFEAIERTAAAGADTIELYPGQRLGVPGAAAHIGVNMSDDHLKALLQHCAKNNVAVANFGVVDIPVDEQEARKVFDFAKKLGVYGVTTESVQALDTLEKMAIAYDMKVCIHNHRTRENYIPGDPAKLWKLFQGRDKRLGYCADLGHWATSGFDPYEIIKRVAPRIHAFHAKDRAKLNGETRDLPFGTGKIRLAEILDEVRKHGFAGNVTIEYEYNWEDSVAEIGQCVGYLRGYSACRNLG